MESYNYEAVGKNIIVEVEQPKSVVGINFGSEFDNQVKARIISVGDKVTEPKLVEGVRILLFKDRLNKLSNTISVTTEDEIITVVGEE